MNIRLTLVTALLLGLAASAQAGSITLTLSTAAGDQAVSVDLADEDIGRSVTAWRALYGQIDDGKEARDRADAEVIGPYLDGMVKTLVNRALEWERAEMVKTATEKMRGMTATSSVPAKTR